MQNSTFSQNVPPTAETRFRGEVLQRIYRIWFFRKLLPVLLAEVILFSLLLYVLGRTVFVQRVLENALNVLFINPQDIFSFILAMFTNATPLARILGFVVLVLLVLVARHFTQGILRLILVRQNYFSRIKT